ncbi:hypothetical protein D3C77_393540 [compost metagenome]
MPDYVIIFLVIMEIEPLFKEWGNPLFTLWYIGMNVMEVGTLEYTEDQSDRGRDDSALFGGERL